MAYKDVTCKYCGRVIGSYHSYQARLALRKHFELNHPKELAEMEKANRVLKDLKNKYSFSGYL